MLILWLFCDFAYFFIFAKKSSAMKQHFYFCIVNLRVFVILLISMILSLDGFSMQCESSAATIDSTNITIYENITELRKSFVYPTFNGCTRPIQLMTVAAIKKVFQYEPGQNVRPIGTTIINIIIDRNGEVKDPKLIKSVWATADINILDILRSIPNITPGTLNGEPIDTKITISIEWDLGRTYFTYTPYNMNGL